ncbi:MAG: ArsR/SmtB family transcription factor [Panacagrimonas sp.]
MNETLSIRDGTELLRLLADGSRLRLLSLLEAHALSAAEITQVTGLAQSRVSTHLTRLKRAGLISDQRLGGAAIYQNRVEQNGIAAQVWALMRNKIDDPQSRLDRERGAEVIRARSQGRGWAASVAGRMELAYSPGRSWETTARALMSLTELGQVLDLASGDGAFAELIAERSRRLTCIDISAAVIDAARKRLSRFSHIELRCADMHALTDADAQYDHVFALNALSYSRQPRQLLRESFRVLRPGGRLVIAALNAHDHTETMHAYDHVNLGIEPAQLRQQLTQVGFDVLQCEVGARETRPPYFEVISALARKP